MKLSRFKEILGTLDGVVFQLEDGTNIPEHVHITEVGQITKHFIDCGGTLRKETLVNFQLWNANDLDHRLYANKLRHIMELSENQLEISDAEIEVEYQIQEGIKTIGKFGLEFNGAQFVLKNKQTTCLAGDQCGIPTEKPKFILAASGNACCVPGSGCC